MGLALPYSGGKKSLRRSRPRLAAPTWRPCVEALEDRSMPSTLMVTNNHDSGKGSLRYEVALAEDGDRVRFVGSLRGKTITLTSGEIKIFVGLDIEGLGANKLTIDGNASSRLFAIQPQTPSPVTIARLTLKNGVDTSGAFGVASGGGAIRDRGASLTLNSDIFLSNQAHNNDSIGGAVAIIAGATANQAVNVDSCSFRLNGANGQDAGYGRGGAIYVNGGSAAGLSVRISNTAFAHNAAIGSEAAQTGGAGVIGGDGQGGAIYVEANYAAGMDVQIDSSTFTGNEADGGSGGFLGSQLAGTPGGVGEGGDVWIDAGSAGHPVFSFRGNTFSLANARGGDGGSGEQGGRGAPGGVAEGGSLYFNGDFASGAALIITSSSFISSKSSGGTGGGTEHEGSSGPGGAAAGGAIEADFANSAGCNITIVSDSFHFCTAAGGTGGGGDGLVGLSGGVGGAALGGALDALISGYASGTLLTVSLTSISNCTARGGDGGAGERGEHAGGRGGDGGLAGGGGMMLRSQNVGIGSGNTWTISSDSVHGCVALSGYGGAGGSPTVSPGIGGDGGNSGVAEGGGVEDEFEGTLQFLHCTFLDNVAASGLGGSGGSGIGSGGSDGADGVRGANFGGGLAIVVTDGTAAATVDTHIALNQADQFPDVYGPLGSV